MINMRIGNMRNNIFLGFTVAEVLITLAIIGIVSAVTVPTMITKYQRKAQLLQLHKVFTEFSQVMGLFAVNDNMGTRVYRSSLSLKGRPNNDGNIATTAGRFLKNYFQVVSDCGADTTPCFAASYTTLDMANDAAFDCEGYAVTLQSGSAICLSPADADTPIEVYIDTNGAKDPNIGGRDMFHFNIYDDGTIDEGVTHEDKKGKGDSPATIRAAVAANCGTTSAGDGCFARLINDDWKMRY